jgi:pimeloyl-ACP methyl ester carboxylesterase
MTVWDYVRDAAVVAGKGIGTAAVWVGENAAAAYRAVDPDLRRHVAQLPLVGLTMLAPAPTVEPLPDDGHRPVVFVPGLGGGPGNFLPMRLYFKLMGRRRTYVLPCDNRQELEANAAGLAALIEAVAAANGLPDDATFDVVTHSMGGLIARLALEDERVRRRVANLVTMAAPHAGSHLARYGAIPRSLDLRPDSALQERLACQVPWPGPPALPRLVCLWSAGDVLLLPAASACVEGADNREIVGFTHYEYLVHPTAWRVALEALAE